MKIVLVLTGILWGSLALACPDLAGTYTCNDNGETYQTVITQHKRADGITVYSSDGDEMIADGQKHDLDLDPGVNGTYTATCLDSSTFNVNIDINAPAQDYKLVAVMNVVKSRANSLDINTITTESVGGQTQKSQQNVSCQK